MDAIDSNTASRLQYWGGLKGIKPFEESIKEAGLYPLKSSGRITTLQVNMGKVCNLMCRHCHVEAGPHRTESMTRGTVSRCLQVLADNRIPTVDITGGAPELNPNLPWLVMEASKIGCHVIVRSNLAVLEMEQYAYLLELYAHYQVEIVASLPCYCQINTDRQRGRGVFPAAIRMLSRLNELGYGQEGGCLKLNLAYNPDGVFLPPSQPALEAEYRRVLLSKYGIRFHSLFTITNAPVGRFLTFLHDSGNLQCYMELLANAFKPAAVNRVMCRELISVAWDGCLYDCDFNQMLGLQCSPAHIDEFGRAAFEGRRIILGDHCYACTAGSGSSCKGAII